MAVKKAMSAIKAVLASRTAPDAQAAEEAPVARAAAARKKPSPTRKKAVVAKPAPEKKRATGKVSVTKSPNSAEAKSPAKPAKTVRKATAKATAKVTAKTPPKTAKAPVPRSAPRSKVKATPTAAPLRTHRPVASSNSSTPSSSARPQRLQVREDESPWTLKELKTVRAELEADIARLRVEISEAEYDLAGLMRDAGEGAGDDQADAGTKTFEREQEISLANNARGMFEQSVHALERIVDGSYGICESCGSPIGKNRLLAFPRATLCMPCKSKQERR